MTAINMFKFLWFQVKSPPVVMLEHADVVMLEHADVVMLEHADEVMLEHADEYVTKKQPSIFSLTEAAMY